MAAVLETCICSYVVCSGVNASSKVEGLSAEVDGVWGEGALYCGCIQSYYLFRNGVSFTRIVTVVKNWQQLIEELKTNTQDVALPMCHSVKNKIVSCSVGLRSQLHFLENRWQPKSSQFCTTIKMVQSRPHASPGTVSMAGYQQIRNV